MSQVTAPLGRIAQGKPRQLRQLATMLELCADEIDRDLHERAMARLAFPAPPIGAAA